MHINKALLESSGIARHFMTDRERRTKKALCQLLIDKGHRKYAERFWKLDLNIVDSSKHPDFTAAISFDEATVYISDGFLGSGQGIFNQLDVLLRHELAHNLMMHQIRLMYVFKKKHSNDPDNAYEHIRYSASLHELLNYIEDFEISNKRYTTEDKKIVRNMQLNGEVISGLVTEDHRQSWMTMPLESMYEELTKELIDINSNIRSNPNWRPIKDGTWNTVDAIKIKGASMIKMYSDYAKPSGIRAPIDVFIKSKSFQKFAAIYQKLVKNIYEAFKDLASTPNNQKIFDCIMGISVTSPQETFELIQPVTGELICTLYTPEDKALAVDVLKNMYGNINYNVDKYKIKKQTNSKEYRDAWNAVVKALDKKRFDDKTLNSIKDAIHNS